MVNSDIKAAFRTFYREKSYAFINLAGLSLAIACCLLLGLYLKDELTYDKHHLKYKQIFRVVDNFNTNGDSADFALTSGVLGPMLKANYPQILDYVRFRYPRGQEEKILIRVDNEAFYWEKVFHADSNVFDIFTHDIIYGDPKTALKDPQSAAVSETFAKKYFGDKNPIGKTIFVDIAPEIPRKITLVFRDLPENNTFLTYDVLLYEQPNLGQSDQKNRLFGINYYTYLLMPKNYNPADYKAISDDFYKRFMEETGKSIKTSWRSWLEPLADIHLDPSLPYDIPNHGNKYYIYGFSTVALFILIVACINYINLAIARATKRAREIGMRKILGVPRAHLIFRYMGEAMIFSFIAMVAGVLLTEAVLKLTSINNLFGKLLQLNYPADLLWVLGLAVVIGVLSGLYPAAYLSSLSPLSALTEAKGKKGAFRLREFLVLLQFTVSVVVIAGTLIMSMQMRYIASKPLGFDKENRIVVYLRGLDVVKKFQVIKNELLKNSNILGITASSGIIGAGKGFGANVAQVDNNDGVLEETGFGHTQVGNDFIKVMGMKMVAGRDFSQRFITDVGTSFIVNEAFVKKRGWDQPLGKRIQLGPMHGKVIGVVRDFHYDSLHDKVGPFVIYPYNDNFENIPETARAAIQRNMILHISGKNIPQTLSFLEDKFAGYDAKHPFDYDFLDDLINEKYLKEENLMTMTGIFSGVCILISCLGLYGLAAYNAEQRKKEIAIRKVLGASAAQIILLLARQILWLVLAGSIAASVIAFFALNEWLTGFAYQVKMAGALLLIFPFSAAIVIAVAFATIALQSYKAARSDPALTMRYE